ncbi:MAG TPA: VOC family protein [Thermoanaerobaculia bacterium]|jgi:predicted enzyme related to lactoylglutathione lyase|nr:VOC family protein [Thermoanaerobaculia bacterium]
MATKKKTAKKPSAKKSAAKSARPKPKAARRPKKATANRPSAAKAARAFVARRQPESLRLEGASPGFTVNDIEKSVAFYRDLLGFTEKDRYMSDGKLQGVELVAGNAHFFLSQDDWKKGRDRVKGVGFRVYCVTVQDVDVLARQIKARGGTLDQEPTTQSWGRDIALTDPDGFRITVMNEKKS